jgi:hypothetical protein
VPIALSTAGYFIGPLFVLGVLGVLVLILRWAFSRGDSLVRRVDSRPADPDTFGLLTGVHTTSAYADARKLVETLTRAQIRSTAARTTKGWSVYVWPADVDKARDVIRSTQQ